MQDNTKQPKPRGLANVSPERRKEIAAMGGRKVQARGTANKFDSAKAREAVALRKDRKKECDHGPWGHNAGYDVCLTCGHREENDNLID